MSDKKNNSMKSVGGDNFQVNIGKNASDVAVGKNINIKSANTSGGISDKDLLIIQNLFDDIRQEINIQVPKEKTTSASERVNELEETLLSDEPNLSTIEYIKNWFEKNFPQIGGMIVSVLVNPIVGKIVEAAGEITAGQFKKMIR